MVLVGNPIMGTSKVANMMDINTIGKITEVVIMKAEGVIEVGFMEAEITDSIAETVVKMRITIEIKIIKMKKPNLFRIFTSTPTCSSNWLAANGSGN